MTNNNQGTNRIIWTASTRFWFNPKREGCDGYNELGNQFEKLREYNRWLLKEVRNQEKVAELKQKIENFNFQLDDYLKQKMENGEISEQEANNRRGYHACLDIDETKDKVIASISWENLELQLNEVDELIDKKNSEILNEFDRRFDIAESNKTL